MSQSRPRQTRAPAAVEPGWGNAAIDGVAPSTPLGLAKTSSTQTTVVVSWALSTDNVAVGGYGLYRGGALVGSSIVPAYSFSGLSCGTTYSLAVDAYDAAGNRSGQTTISAATNACVAGGDTIPPTAPGSLSRTTATTTSITVSWGASTDNIGVSGYGLYRNNASAGSSTTTSAMFSGLSCGASYTLAVDSYDAAGNRSGKTSVAATSACRFRWIRSVRLCLRGWVLARSRRRVWRLFGMRRVTTSV